MKGEIRNKIFCGDAIDIMRDNFLDKSVQMVITSPPYQLVCTSLSRRTRTNLGRRRQLRP
jgi:DNA modification methylase